MLPPQKPQVPQHAHKWSTVEIDGHEWLVCEACEARHDRTAYLEAWRAFVGGRSPTAGRRPARRK